MPAMQGENGIEKVVGGGGGNAKRDVDFFLCIVLYIVKNFYNEHIFIYYV